MNNPTTLNTENYSSKSQIFDDLLEEGISLIQKLSGENWTDYNYHDPGITILEQLCFAITDLGYKSNFTIEDLLMIGVDNFDFEKNNLFIPPNKIFSSNPSTSNDFRKLLIDSVSEINNVWIDTVKHNTKNINGLLDVKLQLKDNISKDIHNDIVMKTEKVLLEHRTLCTDINEIIILKKDIISIGVDIVLDSFYVGEEILAKIFIEIEKRLNDKVKFIGFESFEEKEIKLDKVFQGFETKNGIILEDNLKEKTNQVYVSELIDIIRNIEGVINIKNFIIFKNGIRIYDDIISFSETSYPSFEDIETFFSEDSESEINFIRNNTNYFIDRTIFSQIHDSFNTNNNIPIVKKFLNNNIKKGRFTLDQLSKYFSFINEFPSIYGLKEKELPESSSKLRKAQMKQLKAYLLLFDQVMCNFNTQLLNVRNIFSTDNIDKTLFSDIPHDISGLNEIINAQNLKDYKSKIDEIGEDKYSFIKRRNLFLDHLLSRFSESFNSDLLKKIHQNENPNLSEIQCDYYALNCKINYLKNISNLGRNRNKAKNYYLTSENSSESSGLENRLKLLLDINNTKIQTNIDFDNNNVEFKEKYVWSQTSFKIKNGPEISILSLPEYCYNNNKVNFYLKNYSFFNDLFAHAVKEKSFKIVADNTKHILIYNSPELVQPVKIYQSIKKSDCINKTNEIISKIKDLNLRSEGFLIIENILLRPLNNDKYSLVVSSFQETLIFKSFKITDFIKLSEIRDDLTEILKDRSNFSIHKSNDDSSSFLISVFDIMDNKILVCKRKFKSRVAAKKEIENFILKDVEHSNLKIDIVSKNSTTNNFPDIFNFSNEINIIFPQWPSRFQNIEFKNYIADLVDQFTPAFVKFNLHFLNFKNLKEISETFQEWQQLKSKKVNSKIDIFSLKLIQMLLKLNDE